MTSPACPRPDCDGSVLADGYCDTCGAKAAPAGGPAVASPPPAPPPAPAGLGAPAPGASLAATCPTAGCRGTVLADGYCDTCGAKGSVAPTALRAGEGSSPVSAAVLSRPTGAFVTGSARGSRRTVSTRTSSRSRRSTIGAGVIDVPAAPPVDPSGVIMAVPEVAEEKRFCSACGAPVGRSSAGKPGRSKGFCSACRRPFDFEPKLAPGELVGGQYEVVGCLAHGGLGWIYLVKDTAVNDRWCVLKGLVDAGDEAAMAVAVAERRYLAEVEHPAIVEIYNFVTHAGAGYIVMEYVGGKSLKQLLKQRREAGAGPMPVPEAIAFMLAALPAFAYLHGRGFVYCDFKPDNLIQVADQVKLIDLGGVRRVDDTTGDIYGTVGFQAPEIAELGPSVSGDLYTIGRTLAVLTLDFTGYQSKYRHSLPDPAGHPALERHESFHRFLIKSTAPHPDDRFQSVAELADQLLGVLREVVALETGRPVPGPSAAFAAPPADGSLPDLRPDPSDPAADGLADLPTDDPAATLAALATDLADGRYPETVEVRLRRAAILLAADDAAGVAAELDAIEAADPWEWRAVWLRGRAALQTGDHATADGAFDRCMTEVPGEAAPKLAAAMTAEATGQAAVAAARYRVVATTDPHQVSAVLGLARCQLQLGDVDGAVAAYAMVPRNHRGWGDAQLAAARALLAAGRVQEADAAVARLDLDPVRSASVLVDVLESALAAISSGSSVPAPSARIAGVAVTEPDLRRGLERAYRAVADLTPDDRERYRLVDKANAVRPRSLV